MPVDALRVQTIFLLAVEAVDPINRGALLDRECGADAELRQRVETLLRAHDNPGSFLDQPAVPGVATGFHVPAEAVEQPSPPGPLAEGPGTILGHYKLLQQLGIGGMGVVFLAEQLEPVRRQVALKIVKAGLDSARVVARFEQERQALALMDHPNIARVLDAGTTATGRPFFVMELVKGLPITKFCDQEHLTPQERLELFIPVCQAVQHAHQKGIIHRDLKPSNVLIALYDGKPIPKVIDFGVAKATQQKLTEKTLFTEVGSMVGTLEYMAPEQAELNNLDIDTRADIYSLGVLLYELLTGSPPFTGRQLRAVAFTEMLRMIREVEPSKPSTKLSGSEELPAIAARRKLEPKKLTRQVQGDLDWIVMKCLEKDRGRRYETANGLAQEIQRFLHDEPVQAGPPSRTYRLRKFLRRNKGPVLAVAGVLLALIGGVIGTTLGLVQAEQARQAETDRAEGERLAKLDAQRAADAERVAKLAALKSAEAEKQAKLEAQRAGTAEQQANAQVQKRLRQIEKGIEILTSVFHDLDPKAEDKEGVSLRVLLGRRLEAAAKQLEGEAVGDPVVVARLQGRLGKSLLQLGHYEQAEMVLLKARRTQEDSQGADHPDTLTTKHHLAGVYLGQGKYRQAETLYKEVLVGQTAKRGADHPDTLATKHNLAYVYRIQGKYPQAETLYKEVLEGQTTKRGADDPRTLSSKHGLAELYQSQGKYAQAETLFKDVLEVEIAKLGGHHPDTVATKSNFADLRQKQGKYPEAESLYKEVLEARTAKLGADHPSTLVTKNNLAVLYNSQGKYAQAETLYKEVLQIQATKLGVDHPQTLTTKSNLALQYQSQGKYAQAETLLEEVLEIEIGKRGANHPNTLASKNNLASLHHAQGKYAQAETLFKEALKGQAAALGPDHPGTLVTKNNLGLLYRSQGKYALAERLFQEALAGQLAKLGPDHPNTLTSKSNLATVYHRQGKYGQAETLYREVLEVEIARLGVDHSQSLTTKHNLAMLYVFQGKYVQAETLYKEVLAVRTTKMGADHPSTLATKHNLAALLWSMKRLDRSIPLFEEVLEQMRKKIGPGHPDTLRTLANLGVNYRDAGRLNDGIRCLEEALSVLSKFPAPLAPQLAWIPGELAQTYDQAKQYAKSEPLYVEALQQVRKQYGADDPRTAGLMAQLGLNLLAQKKLGEAEPLLRDCLAIRDQKQPDDWATFNTRSMLGGALLGQKKYKDAKPLLLAGYEGMKQREAQIPAQGRIRLIEALEWLVQLYEALEQQDKAGEWRKQLDAARKALNKTAP